MNIKHLFATGLVTVFSTAVAMSGCAVDSASDAEDEAVSESTEAVTVSVNCTSQSERGFVTPNYERAITASATTAVIAVDGKSTVYDVSALARDRLNLRRRTTHTRVRSGVTQTIKPYYNLYYTGGAPGVVPAYGAIGVKIDETSGTSACRLCKAMAEVATPGHPSFGGCYGSWNPATSSYLYGATYNDVSVGACGAAFGPGVTAQSVVDSCLNTFENENGGGHKGPIVYDAPGRNLTAVIAVYVNGTTTSAEIRFDYTYPTRGAAQPNGANCKLKGECLSNMCVNERCVGFASGVKAGGTAPTSGVSTCPPADSRNCTEHPASEDPFLCFSKNLACASGVCSVAGGVGTCAKGAAGKPCATAADCTSNICNGSGTSKTCG